MTRRIRISIIVSALVLLIASAGLATAMMTRSADQLLTQAIETLETVTTGHFVADAVVETPEDRFSGAVEMWGQLDYGPNGEPAGRLVVLAADKPEMVGVTFVTDGTQFWLYSPTENSVIVGTAETVGAALQARMADVDLSQLPSHDGDFAFDPAAVPTPDPATMPQTPAEAVAKLLEYVTAERVGGEQIGANDAYKLRLVPIAEKMPEQLRLVGGFVNVWLRGSDQLPLALEYAESAVGYAKVTATTAEINRPIDATLFRFDIPDGAEVIDAATLIAEAEMPSGAHGGDTDAAPLAIDTALTPAELPADVTADPVAAFGGALVQRFARADGSTFYVAQGSALPLERPAEATDATPVNVRGVDGTLFSNADGSRTLLTWQEGERTFVVGGDLSADAALAIAESLR